MSESSAIQAGDIVYQILGDGQHLRDALKQAQQMGADMAQSFLDNAKTVGIAFTAIGGSITAALGAAVSVASSYGDEIDKASIKTGVATDALQGLKFGAEQSGVSFEQLQDALIKMNRGIDEAKAGTGPFNDAIKALGISVESLQGMAPDRQFVMLADALSKVEDPAARTAISMDLFGRSGAQLAPLLLEGAQGIDAFGAKAQELGLVMGGDAIKSGVQLGDQIDALKSQFQAIVVEIGSAVIPVLMQIVPVISNVVAGFTNWIKEHPQLVAGITTVVGAIAGIMVAIGPLLFALPSIIAGFGGLGAVATALGAVFVGLTGPIGILGAALAIGLVAAWDTIRAAFVAAVGWIKGHWDQIVAVWDAGKGLALAIMDVFSEALRAVFTVIGAVMDGFGQGVSSAWKSVTSGNKEGSTNFLDTFQQILKVATEVIGSVSEIIGQFANWIASHWDDIASATRFFVENIAQPLFAFAATVAEIAGTVIAWVDAIIDAWNSLPDFVTGGGDINLASPKGKALGGPVGAGVPYIVGEHGEELFVPDRDGRIIPAGLTRNILGDRSAPGGVVEITNHFNIAGYNRDPESLAHEISRIMHQQQIAWGMS